MHFAIQNGNRVAPQKGLEGVVCPVCMQPVYARCGEFRVPHWAHKSVIDCDPWKEPETQWHRAWKDRFGELQEQMHEKDGVRHMADIKTTDGTIVEFRRHVISEEGRRTREAFFGNSLFWVVDCTHRPQLSERFKCNRYYLRQEYCAGDDVWSTVDVEKCFPKAWTFCRRFVFFDFGEMGLWCIFPRNSRRDLAIVMQIDKEKFVAAVKSGYAKFRGRCEDVFHMVKKPKTSHDEYIRDDNKIPVSAAPAVSPVAKPKFISLEPVVEKKAPEEDMWAGEYDRTVSLCVTVDVVRWWHIYKGNITSCHAESAVEGEANATGQCAIHVSSYCGDRELYWAKKKLSKQVAESAWQNFPPSSELIPLGGMVVGLADYHVVDQSSGRIKIFFRNVQKLQTPVPWRNSKEQIWRMDDDLLNAVRSAPVLQS